MPPTPMPNNNKYRTAIEEMYPGWDSPTTSGSSTAPGRCHVGGRSSQHHRGDRCVHPSGAVAGGQNLIERGICLLLRKTLLAWGTLNDNG